MSLLGFGLCAISLIAVGMMVAIAYYHEVIDSLKLENEFLTRNNKKQELQLVRLNADIQIESVKAAYAENRVEKEKAATLSAQSALIMMGVEYTALQDAFAETLAYDAFQLQNLIDELDSQELSE